MKFLLIMSTLLISCEKTKEDFYPCGYDVFWKAVMQAESGGNSHMIYHESFGIDSLGLYQVSFEDAARYACPFKTRDDAFDPLLNTICKDLIAEKIRKRYPNENVWQAMGRYWSTLRHPKYWPGYRTQPFENFKAEAKKLGCEIK